MVPKIHKISQKIWLLSKFLYFRHFYTCSSSWLTPPVSPTGSYSLWGMVTAARTGIRTFMFNSHPPCCFWSSRSSSRKQRERSEPVEQPPPQSKPIRRCLKHSALSPPPQPHHHYLTPVQHGRSGFLRTSGFGHPEPCTGPGVDSEGEVGEHIVAVVDVGDVHLDKDREGGERTELVAGDEDTSHVEQVETASYRSRSWIK